MTKVTEGKPSSIARSTTESRSSMPCLTWSRPVPTWMPCVSHMKGAAAPVPAILCTARSIAKTARQANLKVKRDYSIFPRMDSHEVMNRVGAIIEAHGTGLLATVDEEGNPHLRWLTP